MEIPASFTALLWSALANVANAALPAFFIGVGAVAAVVIVIVILERST